jgi:uncharacterized protein YeaC (DUF1315 family)
MIQEYIENFPVNKIKIKTLFVGSKHCFCGISQRFEDCISHCFHIFQFITQGCTMRFFIWFLTCAVLVLGGARPSGANSQGADKEKNEDRSLRSPTLVGAYYYPWYLDNFHGGGYLREKLQPPQLPVLGAYNDRDTSTTRQHLQWCMDSNIFLWAMSWFGPNTRTDVTSDIILSYMKNEPSTADFPVVDFKVAMLYEAPSRVRLNSATGLYDTSKVKSDVQHLASKFFSHPNYLLINGKPVIYVYLTRWLQGIKVLDKVIALMREGATTAGYPGIYIVGDHSFEDPRYLPATYSPFALLDAVTNYDVYGSMKKPLYAGNKTVEQYFTKQKSWSDKANAAGCDFIPSTTPGFSNTGFKNGELGMRPMSRRLTQQAKEGSLFELMLIKAKAQLDQDTGNMMMITSFNEYHEDTQIEPVTSSVSNTATLPTNLTYGLEYVAYETLYLDLVKKLTA